MQRNKVRSTFRRAVSSLLVLSLTVVPFANSVSAQQRVSATSFSRADYEACQAHDEGAFRAAIETITVGALNAGLKTVDYDALVKEEWRKGNLDDLVDTRVDIAVAEVGEKTSWGTLIQSLAYQEKAQELATAVAEHVYQSDTMKTAIASLAEGVSSEVGGRIELASRDAAGPVLKCLQAFLGPRYGDMIANAVTSDAGADFGVQATAGGADVGPGKVLENSSAGLTGAAILLVRRQLANLARNIGQRLVGTILSRLVSVVAGGVGLVLIARDVWSLSYGVLPIVAEEMKSEATKQKVREELARTISEQIKQHVEVIGQEAAKRVVTVWQEFKSAHAKALELAERDDKFRTFLDTTRPEQLGRLDEIVALVLSAEGEGGINTRLENGTLNEAVNKLPDEAMAIARETRSLETALKWRAVAGEDLDKVVVHGIYKSAGPDDFTASSLRRVLDITERGAISRLVSIKREAREALFDLETDELRGLARNLSADELSTLAQYLTGLEKSAREHVLKTVAQSPGKMQFLASDRIRSAVLRSTDQTAAVEMMLRSDGSFKPDIVLNDFELAWKGQVSPVLIVDKHPIALGVLALALLILLLVVRRLFVGRPKARTEAAGKDGDSADGGKAPA